MAHGGHGGGRCGGHHVRLEQAALHLEKISENTKEFLVEVSFKLNMNL